ncbi:ATP-binding protein [Thermosynechococcaceae cyanobacterium BACA0444]|uniref:ATP-binding protein n=1 Tax=Pseudocalidococcus azoricus BACA0444 TaxID=2918990 RepID=A0AAE4FPU7_9CYAN|nr:ATP-binding protein [Pseudocalidococcus azoricus]MDS3859539.1 ATP-binding protein [Pseudocalidococcus azoricus BACA0444]
MLEIAKEDILSRLRFDNPWWDEGRNGKIIYEDTPRRKYFQPFYQSILEMSVRRAIVLMGPRRVGKTVMVYHSIRTLLDSDIDPKSILYVSLETPIYTGLRLESILNYFQELFGHGRDATLFVFFDEIQYLPNWEVHLKSLVDSFVHYRFVATGSAAAALRLKSNESGAGRFSDYILPPLTFAEYLMFIGREAELITATPIEIDGLKQWAYTAPNIEALNQEFVNYINFGGYPEAVFSETIRKNPSQYIKSDIIDKVLLRDLPSLYGISDIQELNRLFTTLAYNSGNEVSLEALSKSSGVAKNTIRRYLEYLEAAFLIRRVERIDQNAKRFKRAVCFKVYLTNPSMRAALFGQLNAQSEPMGSMTETAIFSQWQHDRVIELFYARWSSGEIDIVHLDTVSQTPSWIVEVKWSDRPYRLRSELDNCLEFANRNPEISQPIMVTSRTITDKSILYKDVEFQFMPASLYTYTLGVNILYYIQEKSIY